MKLKRYLLLMLTTIIIVTVLVGSPDSMRNLTGQGTCQARNHAMPKESKMMEKFDFLLGDWNLEYKVPKSAFSEAATGTGTGTFKRALDDRYVYFDYSAKVAGQEGKAHAIFAWDEKAKVYRYWWFESSGSFLTATCNFVSDEILFLNWHDSLLKQTFKKISKNKVVLRMEHPNSEGEYELILEVIFTKKK